MWAAPVTHEIQRGEFVVRYEIEGPNAIAVEDLNQNQIPDQVENLLTQVIAAKTFFTEGLGFVDPLKSERFRGVEHVVISLRGKEVLKGNGVAFDEIQRANAKIKYPHLLFAVSSAVNPSKNCTPAHEYFHLIQYASTYFKNAWFAEGTARWAEDVFKEVPSRTALNSKKAEFPMSETAKAELATMSYDAFGFFWKPFLEWSQTSPLELIPEEVRAKLELAKYVDGSPVFHRYEVLRGQTMVKLFQELGVQDDLAKRDRKLESWPEKEQRSLENQEYLFRAIQAAIGILPKK